MEWESAWGHGNFRIGPAIGLPVNITDRASVREMLKQTVLAYGGVDSVVVTAGIFVPPDQYRPRDGRTMEAHV